MLIGKQKFHPKLLYFSRTCYFKIFNFVCLLNYRKQSASTLELPLWAFLWRKSIYFEEETHSNKWWRYNKVQKLITIDMILLFMTYCFYCHPPSIKALFDWLMMLPSADLGSFIWAAAASTTASFRKSRILFIDDTARKITFDTWHK